MNFLVNCMFYTLESAKQVISICLFVNYFSYLYLSIYYG